MAMPQFSACQDLKLHLFRMQFLLVNLFYLALNKISVNNDNFFMTGSTAIVAQINKHHIFEPSLA